VQPIRVDNRMARGRHDPDVLATNHPQVLRQPLRATPHIVRVARLPGDAGKAHEVLQLADKASRERRRHTDVWNARVQSFVCDVHWSAFDLGTPPCLDRPLLGSEREMQQSGYSEVPNNGLDIVSQPAGLRSMQSHRRILSRNALQL
jgi:hypothetical protein